MELSIRAYRRIILVFLNKLNAFNFDGNSDSQIKHKFQNKFS